MASSLASQLAQGASLNAALLSGNSRRRQAESYLFATKEAQQHDLDAIYALALNGFAQLSALDCLFLPYAQALFSDAAKITDRTLLPADANAELNKQIAGFLPLLGPYLMEAPTGRVIEWLVRRLRINEFNVEELVTLFLPYHESPHFLKMVSILHIDEKSHCRFLLAYKSTAKALPRSGLVTEMLKNADLTRFVAGLLPSVLKSNIARAHRALVIFHTGVLLDFIARSQDLDEETMVFLLSRSVEPLQLEAGESSEARGSVLQEAILGSLLVLAALSQKCRLTPKALKAILNAVASCTDLISTKQLVRTLLCLCGPQNELNGLPRSLISSLARKTDLVAELTESLAWVGSDKLIVPLMIGLTSKLDKDRYSDLLLTLLSEPSLPHPILRRAASMVLERLVSTQDISKEVAAKKALSSIRLRHTEIVDEVFEEAMKEEEKREVAEKIIMSLSTGFPSGVKTGTDDIDAVVASMNANASIRVLAVRQLFGRLTAANILPAQKDAVKSALCNRSSDTEPPVVAALYRRPAEFVSVLLEDVAGYVSSLALTLHENKSNLSRQLVSLHLAFLAEHFYPALHERDSLAAERIVDELFFPYLVISKPRQKTANAVWAILERCDCEGGIARHELLAGCVDAVRWEQQQGGGSLEGDIGEQEGFKGTEKMAKINLALAAKMADNILASNNYSCLFSSLLTKLRSSDPYARSLGYLVARALLSRLSGEHQIDAAHAMIQATGLENLEGMGEFTKGVHDLSAFLHDLSVATTVVLKANSPNTLQRLQVALLAMLPNIPRPAGVPLDWVSTHSQSPADFQDGDTRGVRYIQLLRAIYALNNSSASLSPLSVHLLRVLFVSLADEAFGFFAGIWLRHTTLTDQADDSHLRVAALRHATAFMDAHYVAKHWLDFQTILPAILVAVQNPDSRVREAAIDCIMVLGKFLQVATPTAIYAYDTIYGSTSHLLQYVDWVDFRKYISALTAIEDHLRHDAAYLRVFHQEHLGAVKEDQKKVASYKQRVLFYLLSHVNACTSSNFKVSLMRSLELVSSPVKCEALNATIEQLLELASRDMDEDYKATEEALELALSSFDASASLLLNDTDKSTWQVFQKSVRICFSSDGPQTARATLIQSLQRGLYSKLAITRKEQICFLLLEIAVQDNYSMSECKALLSQVLSDVSVMMHLLNALQPTVSDAAEPVKKRPRMEVAAQTRLVSSGFSLLLLAEVLSSKSLPGSLDLIINLLETLSKVSRDTNTVAADRSYVEQLLMTSIESCVANVPEDTVVQVGSIRVDVLVQLIRSAENPQTFHQALLLMAALARLAPDAILHNVMPVFTFMGSNVFHRDDTYSFRVVQKTINSIVPVMVNSLRRKHTIRLELYTGAREFLRIFTDASNHIPRHRRARFYSHLVDVLGCDEFLAPVCMLLVEKVSKRVIRQDTDDARASLSLPIATAQQYGREQQIDVLAEFAQEVRRLLIRAIGSDVETCFLMSTTDDEDNIRTICTQRAAALLMFCLQILEELKAVPTTNATCERTASELLSQLLKVTILADSDDSTKDIARTSHIAMTDTLKVMTAMDFVGGALKMLQSSDAKLQVVVLSLISGRISDIAESTRRQLTETMKQIIKNIRSILSSDPEPSLAAAALQSLASIIKTAESEELASLATIVPLVQTRVHVQGTATSALIALLSMCSKLGPRIIPYLRGIVEDCTKVIGSYARSATISDSGPATSAMSVLQSLLTAIPTFWGENEILQVINVYLETCHDVAQVETSFMVPTVKTMTKRLPSRALLPTLSKIWSASPELAGPNLNLSHCTGFFMLVKRALHGTERHVVLEHLRPLFHLFQTTFGLVTEASRSEIEPPLLSSFLELVIKLNETSFRPLFRKLSDWAFTDPESGDDRAVTFCHIYAALLDYFKALMVPYMSFAWTPVLELLEDYSQEAAQDTLLWTSVLATLARTLTCDEGDFWREDKLRQLVPAIIKQIPVCVQLRAAEGRAVLSDCLVATMEVISHDALLKAMNIDILMLTRSDDAAVRLFSLSCSAHLWRTHGEKLLGLVAETTTFIVECAEDDNDSVVREAHSLKDAVESVAGKIDA